MKIAAAIILVTCCALSSCVHPPSSVRAAEPNPNMLVGALYAEAIKHYSATYCQNSQCAFLVSDERLSDSIKRDFPELRDIVDVPRGDGALAYTAKHLRGDKAYVRIVAFEISERENEVTARVSFSSGREREVGFEVILKKQQSQWKLAWMKLISAT
jgi:hypothetical protein